MHLLVRWCHLKKLQFCAGKSPSYPRGKIADVDSKCIRRSDITSHCNKLHMWGKGGRLYSSVRNADSICLPMLCGA